MLNSKQRAFLRGLANRIDTILIVGKGEITDNIIKQADDALTAREIIKVRFLKIVHIHQEKLPKLSQKNVLRMLFR